MAQKILIFKILLLIFFYTTSCFSDPIKIEGYAKIIDGDTININKKKIRLHGIDAPESKQKCFFDKKKWDCGKNSTLYLRKLISKKIVTCNVNGKDKYNRFIAVCFVDKNNINRMIVKNGWAIAYRYYSKDYINEEFLAKINKLGIWKGSFEEPYYFRKKNN